MDEGRSMDNRFAQKSALEKSSVDVYMDIARSLKEEGS